MDRRSFVATTTAVLVGAARHAPYRHRIDHVGLQLYTVRDEIGKRRVGKECRSRWSPYH